MNNTATFNIPLSLRASGSALKIIAVLSMVADHCAYFLMGPDAPFYGVFRSFGRIAFPVFAFLVAEGFANSRNRLRYFLILVLFGIMSELHEFRHAYLLLVVGGDIGRLHLLRLELLAVDSGGEIPVLRVHVAAVGMAVCHLVAVDSHHLRLAWLPLRGSVALSGTM